MLKLLTRNYKRFGLFSFGMACLSLSIVSRLGLGYSQIEHLLFFVKALVGCVLIALGVCIFMPRKRSMLEVAGIAGLLTTLGIIYFCHGNYPFGMEIMAPLAIKTAGFSAVFASVYLILHGRLSQYLGNKLTWRARHSVDLPYPPKLVWKHCVPGAGAPKDHCTGVIESYTPSLDDEDTIRATFKARKHGQAWYDITFLDHDAPRYCRFYFEGKEADGTLVDGMFTITIEVTDQSACTLIVQEERNGLSLHHHLERWLDGALTYHNQKLSEVLETHYGDGSGVTKPLSQAAE